MVCRKPLLLRLVLVLLSWFALPLIFEFKGVAWAAVPLDGQGRPIYAADRIVVKFSKETPGAEREALVKANKGRIYRYFPNIDLYSIEVSSEFEIPVWVERWKRVPGVLVAEPEVCLYPLAAYPYPNDPGYQFGAQWPIDRTEIGRAWNEIEPMATLAKGSGSAVVAVIDWGILPTHEDLATKLWVNPGEIPGNGIDDDGNGFIDDVNGWDFGTNDNTLYNPNSNHGTEISGLIGAQPNNGKCIPGMAWQPKIMMIKIADDTGVAFSPNALAGMQYAIDMSADVMNMSFAGIYDAQQDAKCAEAWAAGIVPVAAAGNSGTTVMEYPASCADVISVAGTWGSDAWSSTNHNAEVELAAPCEGSDSTSGSVGTGCSPTGCGSSASSAFVSGLAVVLKSWGLTNVDIRNRLRVTSDDVNSGTYPGWDEYLGYGRINAYNAIGSIVPPQTVIASPNLSSVDLSWLPPNVSPYGVVRYEVHKGSSPFGPFTLAATVTAPTTVYSDTSVTYGIQACYVIYAVDAKGLTTLASAPACASLFTRTPTISATYTVTPTDSPTATWTPTSTPTGTFTTTPTWTPTASPTSTSTITPTGTFSKTTTPTLTLTPTPPNLGVGEHYVYPNPARDDAHFVIGLAQAGNVRLLIFNADYERVWEGSRSLDAGKAQIEVDVSNWTLGVYYYLIEVNGKRLTPGKFAVIH